MDIGFLFVAVALQVVRQYMLTKFSERLDGQAAAKRTKNFFGEGSYERIHTYYNPSLEEIKYSHHVPFDANIGANGALAWLVFSKTKDKLLNEGLEGKKKVGARQWTGCCARWH